MRKRKTETIRLDGRRDSERRWYRLKSFQSGEFEMSVAFRVHAMIKARHPGNSYRLIVMPYNWLIAH